MCSKMYSKWLIYLTTKNNFWLYFVRISKLAIDGTYANSDFWDSDLWGVGLVDLRTYEIRTCGLSDLCNFGLMQRRTCGIRTYGPSDLWAFGLLTRPRREGQKIWFFCVRNTWMPPWYSYKKAWMKAGQYSNNTYWTSHLKIQLNFCQTICFKGPILYCIQIK